jgi:hypothetical protein
MFGFPKRSIVLLVLALVTLLCLGFAMKSCSDARTAATRAKLESKQSGAAIESGRDAVQTVGNRSTAEANGAAQVQETKDAINNATDVPGITDAGRNGLCKTRRTC